MPYNLALPGPFGGDGWKVKIFEKETVEPPHVTIVKGTSRWRIDLRTKKFMDKKPPYRQVPADLVAYVIGQHEELVNQWNQKYPHNLV